MLLAILTHRGLPSDPPARAAARSPPRRIAGAWSRRALAARARSADEGRSAFTKQGGGNKIGEQIVDKRITIFSDPQDPQLLAQPYDGAGLPLSRPMRTCGAAEKNVGAFSWDGVRNLAATSGGKDPWGYRAEFLDLVDRARRLTSGQAPVALSE